ncbi:MAG: hypothetical protein C0475_02225 [Planctomyces sp.]|nr:hypothetical protein [Planctomyces sp.]MBA4120818.1 hypothetical protein [Isosphaera sp.]
MKTEHPYSLHGPNGPAWGGPALVNALWLRSAGPGPVSFDQLDESVHQPLWHVYDAALEVLGALGASMHAGAYIDALDQELAWRSVPSRLGVRLPIPYKLRGGVSLLCPMVVAGSVAVFVSPGQSPSEETTSAARTLMRHSVIPAVLILCFGAHTAESASLCLIGENAHAGPASGANGRLRVSAGPQPYALRIGGAAGAPAVP